MGLISRVSSRTYRKFMLLRRMLSSDLKTLRLAYCDLSNQLLENAMDISTVDTRNRPSNRYVLLKDVKQDKGFVFFTHGISRKGQQLAKNPYIAATFFWPELHRSIRIEGKTELLDVSEADKYFYSRPLESQAAGACSEQSAVIESKEKLIENYEKELEKGEEVKRPESWRGYLIKPDYFEFWQGHSARLHDRIVFKRDGFDDGEWGTERLQP